MGNIKLFLQNILKRFFSSPEDDHNRNLSHFSRNKNNYGSLSYSQCGEDLIIDFIFKNYLKIESPAYIDIGAHHPVYLSNTYFFYKKGARGLCIEPDPFLFKVLEKERRRDICLNLGIGSGPDHVSEFYIMSEKTLNTFSKENADSLQSYGSHKIEDVIQVPLININEVIEKYFQTCPNLVSLDVEGIDFDILSSFNFDKYRPEVFCIETLTYVQDKSEQKIYKTIDFMKQKNYFVYADTFINTIFVDKNSWDRRS